MPVKIAKTPEFLADAELQFEWYLDEADEEVAGRYLGSLHETLGRIARQPLLGREHRSRSSRLKGLRRMLVTRPFQMHLVFYRLKGETAEIVRVMHGVRDLPRRLQQSPGSD